MAAPVRVVQWAQERGEVGGVSTSVHGLTEALRREGVRVDYLDTGSLARALRALPRLWGPGTAHLFHITRLWRAEVMAPVFAALPGRTVLVLHSGSTREQVQERSGPARRRLVLALHAYDRIWAVNQQIREVLPGDLADRTTVVNPWVPSALDTTVTLPRQPHLLAVATNAGQAHYNADLAVEATRLVRRSWPDARLHVLAYGSDGPLLAGLRRRVAAEDWVDVDFDLDAGQVAEALGEAAVLLRPTSWDGDSVIVREAIATGTRVVASDVSPRPRGTELAALDAEAFAEAVLRGGRPSDGAGVVEDSILSAATMLVQELAGAGDVPQGPDPTPARR